LQTDGQTNAQQSTTDVYGDQRCTADDEISQTGNLGIRILRIQKKAFENIRIFATFEMSKIFKVG